MGLDSFPENSHNSPPNRPKNQLGLLAAVLGVLSACEKTDYEVPIQYGEPIIDEGENFVGYGRWTLPFPSGNYWKVVQGYETGTHTDWGFEYGDDTYALDFSRAGCEAYGMAITPVESGEVLETGAEEDGYGRSLLVEHEDGYVSRYAHLSEILVSEGDHVEVDSQIAAVGNSGDVDGEACTEHPGTHLHLALYLNGDGAKPEPLSGRSPMSVGCWYNREGSEDCTKH